MALPQVQSYRAGVANAPAAATPSVTFGQQTRADLAVQAEAQYQNTMGQVLDRISSSLFKVAETQSAREGLQFAVDNPLTPEQLKAMSDGRMPEDLDLGSPLNVFNNAVRKARAIEVSAHFEIEDTRKLLDIADQAERGMISTEDARNKITALINASAQTQANIDPDASYKYRASMSAQGARVIDYIAKQEIEKNKVANVFKVDQAYTNMMGLLAKDIINPQPINPATNAEWDIGTVLDQRVKNFLNNATSLIGAQDAAKYVAKIQGDIENLMVSAVNRELMNPQYMANTTETFRRIANGDIDNVKQVASYLLVRKPEALQTIASNFRTMISDDITRKNQEEADRKRRVEEETTVGMIEYFNANTTSQRKRQIVMEIAKSGGFTLAQMEQFLDPRRKEGDPFVEADLKAQIVNGDITTTDQLKSIATRAGMNGNQYGRLMNELLQGFDKQKADAQRFRKAVAGVPDVRSTFVTKDNEHLINKAKKLDEMTERKAAEFRVANPGQLVPWMSLSEQAVAEYDKIVAADKKKQKAEKELKDFVNDILIPDKKVTADFVIDATNNSNVDDLISRGIIKELDRKYVQDRIDILKAVPQ